MVTENGAAFDDGSRADGQVHDDRRIDYLHGHIDAVGEAIDAGADVRGYFVWSLLDNFEWAYGYDRRFGIIRVDYDTQERTWKDSAALVPRPDHRTPPGTLFDQEVIAVKPRPRLALLPAAALVASLGLAGPAKAQSTYPFQNPRLPLNARVDDLVGRLTLDEKISLLHQYQPAIPRLGIEAVQDRHRGAARRRLVERRPQRRRRRDRDSGTVFPQAVGPGQHLGPGPHRAGRLGRRRRGPRLQHAQTRTCGACSCGRRS